MKIKKIMGFIFLFATSSVLFFSEPSLGINIDDDSVFDSKDVHLSVNSLFLRASFSELFNVEDPTSIYNFELYDNEVEFLIDGYWNVSLSSSYIIPINKNKPIQIIPPIFVQKVDLSTWVLIDEQWYFESSFTEDFSNNNVSLGYIGKEKDVIKHIRIGNSNINFPNKYPFIHVGEGGNSPGIMGSFAKNNWTADSIIRYQSSELKEMILIGNNEQIELKTPITKWTSGKWLIIPQAPIYDYITVFVEDDTGTILDEYNRTWRTLRANEYSVSGLQGIVEIFEEHKGAIAIHFESMNPTTIDTFLLETKDFFGSVHDEETIDFYIKKAQDYQISLSGKQCLVVYETGRFSPFMIASRYKTNGESFVVMHSETGIMSSTVFVRPYNKIFSEVYTDIFGTHDIRKAKARFPLISNFPNLYFPAFGGNLPDTDLVLQAKTYVSNDIIQLGKNTLPGTITVRRNGFIDTSFDFDPDTGILNLTIPIAQTDRIQIRWFETEEGAKNANLIIAQGINWMPLSNFSFSIGSMLSWSFSKQTYTDASTSSPGSFLVSFGGHWENTTKNNTQYDLETYFGFELYTHDTTGLFRIEGMDYTPKKVYLKSNLFKPISENLSIKIDIEGNEQLLNNINQVQLSTTNENLLPVFEDSSVGTVLDFSCTFSNQDQWAATLISTDETDIDLTKLAHLSIDIKNIASNHYDLYLQLGVSHSSLYDDSEYIRTWKLNYTENNTRWYKNTIFLSKEDRKILNRGNNMRLIAVAKTPIIDENVNFYATNIEFLYEDFTYQTNDSSTIIVSKIFDPALQSLKSTYPQPVLKFNQEHTNSVLNITYTPKDENSKAIISKYVPTVPLLNYNKFGFFIYRKDNEDATGNNNDSFVCVSLGSTNTFDADDESIRIKIPLSVLSQNTWNHIELDYKTQKLFINGEQNSNSDIFVHTKTQTNKIKIEINGYNGNLYIDELYLFESTTEYTGKNETNFSLTKKGTILKLGPIDILKNIFFSVKTYSFVSKNYQFPQTTSTTISEFHLLNAEITTSILVSSKENVEIEQTSHSIKIPIRKFSIYEKFNANFLQETWARENKLVLTTPLSVQTSIGSQKEQNILKQSVYGKIESKKQIKANQTNLCLISGFVNSEFGQITHIPLGASINDQHNFPTYWKKSFEHACSFGEDKALQRKTQNEITLEVIENRDKKPILFGLTTHAKIANYYISSLQTTNSAHMELNLGLPVTISSVQLKPIWTRIAEQTQYSQPGGDYRSDLLFVQSSIKDMAHLYTIPVFYDLFDPRIQEKLYNDYSYPRMLSNTYGLDISRTNSGKIFDVFIPQFFSYAITRESKLEDTMLHFTDSITMPCRMHFVAFNIFGAFSALQFFPWYEQDEIIHTYNWKPMWNESGFSYVVMASQSITIFITNDNSFALDNVTHFENNKTHESIFKENISLAWKRTGKDSLMVYPVSYFTNLEIQTNREDVFNFSYSSKGNQKSVSSAYEHILRTVIGKNGELSVHIGMKIRDFLTENAIAEINLGFGGSLYF